MILISKASVFLYTLYRVYKKSSLSSPSSSEALDSGHPAFLVMLDFSAAFDAIDHQILLDRSIQPYTGFGYISPLEFST